MNRWKNRAPRRRRTKKVAGAFDFGIVECCACTTDLMNVDPRGWAVDANIDSSEANGRDRLLFDGEGPPPPVASTEKIESLLSDGDSSEEEEEATDGPDEQRPASESMNTVSVSIVDDARSVEVGERSPTEENMKNLSIDDGGSEEEADDPEEERRPSTSEDYVDLNIASFCSDDATRRSAELEVVGREEQSPRSPSTLLYQDQNLKENNFRVPSYGSRGGRRRHRPTDPTNVVIPDATRVLDFILARNERRKERFGNDVSPDDNLTKEAVVDARTVATTSERREGRSRNDVAPDETTKKATIDIDARAAAAKTGSRGGEPRPGRDPPSRAPSRDVRDRHRPTSPLIGACWDDGKFPSWDMYCQTSREGRYIDLIDLVSPDPETSDPAARFATSEEHAYSANLMMAGNGDERAVSPASDRPSTNRRQRTNLLCLFGAKGGGGGDDDDNGNCAMSSRAPRGFEIGGGFDPLAYSYGKVAEHEEPETSSGDYANARKKSVTFHASLVTTASGTGLSIPPRSMVPVESILKSKRETDAVAPSSSGAAPVRKSPAASSIRRLFRIIRRSGGPNDEGGRTTEEGRTSGPSDSGASGPSSSSSRKNAHSAEDAPERNGGDVPGKDPTDGNARSAHVASNVDDDGPASSTAAMANSFEKDDCEAASVPVGAEPSGRAVGIGAPPTITVFGNIEHSILVPAAEDPAATGPPYREEIAVVAEKSGGAESTRALPAAAVDDAETIAGVLSAFYEYRSNIDDDDDGNVSLDSQRSRLSDDDARPYPVDDVVVLGTSRFSRSSRPAPVHEKRRLTDGIWRRGRTRAVERSPIEMTVAAGESQGRVTEACVAEIETVDEVGLGANRRIDQTIIGGQVQPTDHDDALPRSAASVDCTDDVELHHHCSLSADGEAVTSGPPIRWNGRIVARCAPLGIDATSDDAAANPPARCRVDPSKFDLVGAEEGEIGEKRRRRRPKLGAARWNPWEEETCSVPPVADDGLRSPHPNAAGRDDAESLPATNIVLNLYLFDQNEPSKQAVKTRVICSDEDTVANTLQRLQSSVQKIIGGNARGQRQLAKNGEHDAERGRVERQTGQEASLWRKKATGVSVSAVNPSPNAKDSTGRAFFEGLLRGGVVPIDFRNLLRGNRGRQRRRSAEKGKNSEGKNARRRRGSANLPQNYERVQNARSIAIRELLARATQEDFGKYAVSLPVVVLSSRDGSDDAVVSWIPLLLDSCPPTIVSVRTSVPFGQGRIFEKD